MSPQQKVDDAMRKGLVDVVEALLGKAPTRMYDYGMQFEWKKRARQWIADQRRPAAIYPIHCWSAGYGGPQTPLTWYACSTCGRENLGSPHALPERDCMMCAFEGRESGWVVADTSTAVRATMKAADGMPAHSLDNVMNGPR